MSKRIMAAWIAASAMAVHAVPAAAEWQCEFEMGGVCSSRAVGGMCAVYGRHGEVVWSQCTPTSVPDSNNRVSCSCPGGSSSGSGGSDSPPSSPSGSSWIYCEPGNAQANKLCEKASVPTALVLNEAEVLILSCAQKKIIPGLFLAGKAWGSSPWKCVWRSTACRSSRSATSSRRR